MDAKDGLRREIACNGCGGHVGHLYRHEGFTNPAPNERHCINSSAVMLRRAGAPTVGCAASAGGVEPFLRCTYAGPVWAVSYRRAEPPALLRQTTLEGLGGGTGVLPPELAELVARHPNPSADAT